MAIAERELTTSYTISGSTIERAQQLGYTMPGASDLILPWLPRTAVQNDFVHKYSRMLLEQVGKNRFGVGAYLDGFRVADRVFRLHCDTNGTPIPEVNLGHYNVLLHSTRKSDVTARILGGLSNPDDSEARAEADRIRRILEVMQPELPQFANERGPGVKLLSTMGLLDGVLPFHIAIRMK